MDEAVSLLRSLPSSVWALHLLAAVPLTLAVLYLLHDMGTGFSSDRSLPDSLLCTAAFFWSVFWKARFAARLEAQLLGAPAPALNQSWDCLWIQGCLQAPKLFLLPLALVSVLPLPWVIALFRTLNLEANRPRTSLPATLSRSLAQASAAQKQLWVLMPVLASVSVVLFLNILIAVLLVPYALRTLTGWETEWTRSFSALASFDLFTVAAALTWLLLDPLLQACFVLRSFYWSAGRDGRDLFRKLRTITAASLLAAALFTLPAQAAAPSLSQTETNHAVDRASHNPEFSWLHTKPPAPLPHSFLGRILGDIRWLFDRIGHACTSLFDWIGKLFRNPDAPNHLTPDHARPSRSGLRWTLSALVGVLLVVMVIVVLRTRNAARPQPKLAPTAPTPIDLQSDLLATERPGDEWLALAQTYISRGDLRSAVRAFYLANLASLGARQLLLISRSKSNGLYERELQRRAPSPTIPDAFTRANRLYERVWYGLHEVTPELTAALQSDVAVIQNGSELHV